MEPFSAYGQYWMLQTPEHVVPGELAFDADGLVLEVDGALVEFRMPTEGVVRLGEPQWVEHPVVHGTLRDGSPVTLFAVGGVNPEGPFSASREIWRPQMVLNGVHAVEDSFDRVTFQFDCLVPWTEPPPVVRDVPGNGSVLDLSRTTLESASLGESEVLLRASWTGQSGGDSSAGRAASVL